MLFNGNHFKFSVFTIRLISYSFWNTFVRCVIILLCWPSTAYLDRRPDEWCRRGKRGGNRFSGGHLSGLTTPGRRSSNIGRWSVAGQTGGMEVGADVSVDRLDAKTARHSRIRRSTGSAYRAGADSLAEVASSERHSTPRCCTVSVSITCRRIPYTVFLNVFRFTRDQDK